MLTICLIVLTGLLSAGVGAVISWRLLRRQDREDAPPSGIAPDIEQQINVAAEQWAVAQGQPVAAPLLARRLRLLYVLSQRDGRRRWSR